MLRQDQVYRSWPLPLSLSLLWTPSFFWVDGCQRYKKEKWLMAVPDKIVIPL